MSSRYTFTLPAGLHRFKEILALQEWVKSCGKDVEIAVYDTVQGLQWNGGRPMLGKVSARPFALTRDDIDEAVSRARCLNDAGIPVSLTFNSTLSSVDVDDEVGNYLLHKLHNEMNSVTVSTEMLRGYIASTYPKYKLTASICYSFTKPEDYLPLFERHDLVVMMPVMAYQLDVLKTLPIEKMSFILNEVCWLFCPRKDHYDYISRCFMSGNTSPRDQSMHMAGNGCMLTDAKHGPRMRAQVDRALVQHIDKIRKTQLMDLEVETEKIAVEGCSGSYNITPTARKALINLGVRQFKLHGRDFNHEEYQKEVIDAFKRLVSQEL